MYPVRQIKKTGANTCKNHRLLIKRGDESEKLPKLNVYLIKEQPKYGNI